MNLRHDAWAIVLAAGAGQRLSQLTVTADGSSVPKQFCSLIGALTLFEATLLRARGVVAAAHVTAVVAAQHRRWWTALTQSMSPENVFVQPENRGTALGIMLACLQLEARGLDVPVVLLPSDHFVRDEFALRAALTGAIAQVAHASTDVVLLGMTPEEPDSELGYVVPGPACGPVREVIEFVEKPTRGEALSLIARGAVWNSFILVARASSLLELIARDHGASLTALRAALRRDGWPSAGGRALAQAYRALTEIDFSRHVLTGSESVLRVLTVPACGWTDLGTPGRVARCVAELRTDDRDNRSTATARSAPHLSLVQACTALRCAG